MQALSVQAKVSRPQEIAPDSGWIPNGEILKSRSGPRDWSGPSQKGKRFSRCPPEYLDLVAKRLDFFADKETKNNVVTSSGKPKAPYTQRDAARARGWAKRLREGWTTARRTEMTSSWGSDVDADDIKW